jgi:hypothetical protein
MFRALAFFLLLPVFAHAACTGGIGYSPFNCTVPATMGLTDIVLGGSMSGATTNDTVKFTGTQIVGLDHSASPVTANAITQPLSTWAGYLSGTINTNPVLGSNYIITGGSIDSTPIGANVPANGNFAAFTTTGTALIAGAATFQNTLNVNGTLTANGTFVGAAPAGSLTGTTLASNVVSSSLTSAAGGPFGTAAYVSTGTAGDTVPLLNASNTFSTGTLTKTGYLEVFQNIAFSGGTGGGPGISPIWATSNVSGTTDSKVTPYEFFIGGDNLAGNMDAFTLAYFWGGSNFSGARNAQVIYMQDQAGTVAASQMSALQISMQASHPGTHGVYFGLNPAVNINPGATGYQGFNVWGEGDLSVIGQSVSVTPGGTATNGDVMQLIFTSAGISGSPVTTSYTVGTGIGLKSMMGGMCSSIWNTPALVAAGVSCLMPSTGSSFMTVYWPDAISVTVTKNVTGSATETITLGTPVAGGDVQQKLGWSLMHDIDTMHGISGGPDVAMIIGGWPRTPTAGWDVGISFGSAFTFSEWPMLPTSTMIGAQFNPYTGGFGLPDIPYLAKYGFDAHIVNFSNQSGYSLYLPGYLVDGLGNQTIEGSTLTSSSAGLSISANGYIGTGNAGISNGGGGPSGSAGNRYYVNDEVVDALGGQHVVTGVNASTGAVTGVTTWVQPSSSGSLPSTTQATTGGSGTGLVLSISWVHANTLTLQNWGVSLGVSANSNGTPAFGGTTAAVGDQLTLNDGCSTHAQLVVGTVSAGAVTRYNIVNPGICNMPPANPVGVSTSTGTDTSETFNLTWAPNIIQWLGTNSLFNNGGNMFITGTPPQYYSGTESNLTGYRAGIDIGSGNFNNIYGHDAAGSGNGCASTPIYVGSTSVFGTDALRNTCGNAEVTLMGVSVMKDYAQAGTASNNYAWGNTGFGGSALQHWNGAVAFPYNTAMGDTSCVGATGASFTGVACFGAKNGNVLSTAANALIMNGGTNGRVGNTTFASGSGVILVGSGRLVVDTPAAGTTDFINVENTYIASTTTPSWVSGFNATAPGPAGSTYGTTSERFGWLTGTGTAASSGVFAFATAAPNGWHCVGRDETNPASYTEDFAATSTTQVTVTNYSRTTGLAANWTASDILDVSCQGF